MHPEVQQLESVYRQSGEGIFLEKDFIIRWWELGLIGDAFYLLLIFRLEQKGQWADRFDNKQLKLSPRDFDYLIHQWQGITPKNEKGGVKLLTVEKITNALATLHGKGDELFTLTPQQLTLTFGYEAGIQ